MKNKWLTAFFILTSIEICVSLFNISITLNINLIEVLINGIAGLLATISLILIILKNKIGVYIGFIASTIYFINGIIIYSLLGLVLLFTLAEVNHFGQSSLNLQLFNIFIIIYLILLPTIYFITLYKIKNEFNHKIKS
jgi:hypothetical protein